MTALEERFLSTEEVAERLQVDEQTIRRWIKSGKLEAVKPGREWRIFPGAFEALLERYSSPKAPSTLTASELEQRRSELTERVIALSGDPVGLPQKLGGVASPSEKARHLRELGEVADELHAVARELGVLESKKVTA